MLQRAKHPYAFDELGPPDAMVFGNSETMAAVRRNLLKVADTDIPVLVEGESGTGKEVICKFLHQHSAWKDAPFARVSCPALAGTLLGRELFGARADDFAGIFADEPIGVVRGTLFLDEVSELEPALQARLLQTLQGGQLQGGESPHGKRVQMRVICTTNRRLQKEVVAGRFRQDLYYRISGLVLRLPPLRERLEDLERLSAYFVGLYNDRFQCSAPPLSESTLMAMTTHPWMGNIRELENLIKRYVVAGTEDAILGEIAAHEAAAGSTEEDHGSALSLGQLTRNATRLMESRIILNSLRANEWNRRRTARELKISYRSLLYKLKRAGVEGRRRVDSAGAEGRTLGNLS